MTQIPTAVREAQVFVDAAASTSANALTACRGWTAHDLLAHVVAGGAEIARLVALHLDGHSHEQTTPFAEREPAFRQIPYADLVDIVASAGLAELLGSMTSRAHDAELDFTGWSMSAASLSLHIRSELALHAWDLVGSTPAVVEVLSQPELTQHAASSLNNLDSIAERSSARTARFRATDIAAQAWRLRVEQRDDVLIELSSTSTKIEICPLSSEAAVTTDAAGRLLMLWGRTPPALHASVSEISSSDLRALHTWLYA